MSHLGDRISALVDGELGHAGPRPRPRPRRPLPVLPRRCSTSERAVKDALAVRRAPAPPAALLDAPARASPLPGGPLPPRARTMPQGPVVPALPPPGRSPRGARGRLARPAVVRRQDARRGQPGPLRGRGALSVAGPGAGHRVRGRRHRRQPAATVVPAAAELSVEHTATTSGFTVGDPGLGMSASFGDVFYPTAPRR